MTTFSSETDIPMLHKKALFLDRDGVININHGYVYQIDKFEFIDGIFELCKKARDKGYQIIIVTNQSGIARGYYSEKTFKQLTKWVEHQFWKKGIKITHTFHCPHHPKYSHPCCCRKPRPGMLTKASRYFRIDRSKSIMIGDSLSDMQAARSVGIGRRLYLNHRLTKQKGQFIPPDRHWYYQAGNLLHAKKLL
jgi:D-glycero-D-manno-heptose 1,7-bisphosphate phosphatase